MSCLRMLIEQGFEVETDQANRLLVGHRERLDDNLRAFIRAHKAEIVAELRTVGGGLSDEEMRLHAILQGPAPSHCYVVRIDGKTVTTYGRNDPAEMLQELIARFGPDRGIWITECWPIRN